MRVTCRCIHLSEQRGKGVGWSCEILKIFHHSEIGKYRSLSHIFLLRYQRTEHFRQSSKTSLLKVTAPPVNGNARRRTKIAESFMGGIP